MNDNSTGAIRELILLDASRGQAAAGDGTTKAAVGNKAWAKKEKSVPSLPL
jgi:hypothetical protein